MRFITRLPRAAPARCRPLGTARSRQQEGHSQDHRRHDEHARNAREDGGQVLIAHPGENVVADQLVGRRVRQPREALVLSHPLQPVSVRRGEGREEGDAQSGERTAPIASA